MCWASPGFVPPRDSSLVGEKGSILLITLLFMLVLALLAKAVTEGSALQLRMVGNHERQELALQQARAVSTELSTGHSDFLLTSKPGESNCAPTNADPDCDHHRLFTMPSVPLPRGLAVDYRIERRYPWQVYGLPTRDSQEKVSSVRGAAVALFEVDVTVGSGVRVSGNSRVLRGVAVRIDSIH